MEKYVFYNIIFSSLRLLASHFAWHPFRMIIMVVLIWYPSFIFAQNFPHPSFRHYTTDDGLASPEVYHIVQDKKGYIWIATDNGVSRFDGYDFRNYGVKEGLVENVIFMMQLDSLDRLWMQAMNGRLYYFDNETIRPYQHNKVIDSFINRSDNKGFIVEGAGEIVHYASFSKGVISIANDGSYTLEKHAEPLSWEVFERKEIVITSSSYNGSFEEAAIFLKGLNKRNRSGPLYLNTREETWDFSDLEHSAPTGQYNFGAYYLGDEKYLVKVLGDIYYFENGKVIWHKFFPHRILDLRLMKNGQLFVGYGYEKGLGVYASLESFRKDEGSIWLSGETVSYILEGDDGIVWFATNENGIYNVSSDEITVYDKETGLSDNRVTALTIKNENELFVGLNNGEIWQLNHIKGNWTALPELPSYGFIRDIFFEPASQRLWAGRGELYHLENEKWLSIKSSLPKSNYLLASRITQSPDKKHLWLGSHVGFYGVNLKEFLDDSINSEQSRTYVVREDYQGKVWVGKSDGLYEWKANKLQKCDSLNQLFNLRIEDIALTPDSTLVVATKGGGLVFWKGDKMEQISTVDGLTADMLECVHADESGTVWAGTLNGVNRISGTFGKWEVDQITVSHGLPSNEINKINTLGDQVWLATNRGLVHFANKKNIRNSLPKPSFASVIANNDSVDLSKAIELKSHQNNLTFHFFAINYKMNGKIPYRYRLDNGIWMETMNRSLNFLSLSPGDRVFEVQAQNENGKWSESTILEFVILPPWWATWWVIAALIFSGLLLVLGIYKYRTGRLKKANKIQLKIAELERSALQAQMNPHFIFNCLNSIQNFILQNEKESAITYLGSFASLVRSMLNASVSGKIPLEEEIRLLNNYLELEKLRFKNRFTYEIKTQEGIDVFGIKIPPLLVQPYVENALIHGMSGKTSGGKVLVFFEEKSDYLKVSVTDNGGGIIANRAQQNNSKLHKSFGMAITKNRLELLADKKGSNSVITTNLYNEKGEIAGTQVIIRIGIKEDSGN